MMMSNILETDMIDDAEHNVDLAMVTGSEDEIKVWGNMMTQYSLKVGQKKIGDRRATAAMEKHTQLHIMDTWKAMNPSKLS